MRWEQPWGERRFVRDHHNELRVRYTEKSRRRALRPAQHGRRLPRLRRRGRLPLRIPACPRPGHHRRGDHRVRGGAAGDRLVDPAFQWNREEYLYNRTRLTEVGIAQTPMTIRTEDGLHIAFHEAAWSTIPA
jgi:alpha-glucosidase